MDTGFGRWLWFGILKVDGGNLTEQVGGPLHSSVSMDWLCCFWPSYSELVGGRSSSTSGKGKNHEGLIKYGFSLVKGKANHPMEDYHVAKFVQVQRHELGLFAIYDGHLGDSVPAYLQKHLFSNILKEEEFWDDPNRSISKAYERTDQAILSNSSDLGRGGSTAVTAILINGERLWVANVGDSRAVLSRGGQAMQMTVDHEPNTERGSIENRGGFVSNMPGEVVLKLFMHIVQIVLLLGDVPRVNGQLAVSRAFGDKSLKSHLRSDPDIQEIDINNNTEVLVLASDGLWKVMSNQEAVDIARRIKDPLKAAKQLTTEALKRESKDDISCVVGLPIGGLDKWKTHTLVGVLHRISSSLEFAEGKGKKGRLERIPHCKIILLIRFWCLISSWIITSDVYCVLSCLEDRFIFVFDEEYGFDCDWKNFTDQFSELLLSRASLRLPLLLALKFMIF
ncbi:hypothetical protein SADUNF_Sadunf05G0117500 [Salix dunnii]|uniref:PPM-type phosphatase domain-containing protein n=1 Tax=Salix dunnii TaxID=1413687 RepID=A0A835N280_9ROSI|nr:hypothetical protein SADUNF_Sadunf05G0117500 [Salix dunnii]